MWQAHVRDFDTIRIYDAANGVRGRLAPWTNPGPQSRKDRSQATAAGADFPETCCGVFGGQKTR
jgi:hypothetical protein